LGLEFETFASEDAYLRSKEARSWNLQYTSIGFATIVPVVMVKFASVVGVPAPTDDTRSITVVWDVTLLPLGVVVKSSVRGAETTTGVMRAERHYAPPGMDNPL
jgi:hypothetical protein